MNADNLIESQKDQVIASLIAFNNQQNLNSLLEKFSLQTQNLGNALEDIKWSIDQVDGLIYSNRGGNKGIHGFIAEVSEVGISNAREQILGRKAVTEWINDNGQDDIRRAGQSIQQKFSMNGRKFSLDAVVQHKEKYTDFLSNNGIYQIPKDHYEAIRYLRELPISEAKKLSSSNDGFSYREWKAVNEFMDQKSISLNDLEPSKLEYHEVQRNAIHGTLEKEKKSLKKENQQQRKESFKKSKSSIHQGLKATGAAATIEGTTTLALAVRSRLKQDKKVSDFTEEDWREISKETGVGIVKGGIRGAATFSLTSIVTTDVARTVTNYPGLENLSGLKNVAATPAVTASSLVTASFSIADLAFQMRQGKLTETEFLENAQYACLDASVSAFSTLVGQAIIPVPILGGLIGNAVGTVLYQVAKEGFQERERKILESYAIKQRELSLELGAEYQELVTRLTESLTKYLQIIDRAFAPDIEVAFAGSIDLAKDLGVQDEDILDSQEKINSFFLD